MIDNPVIDLSYNKETGELQQFTVIGADGAPRLVKATAENVLLYDPEDELPFDNGLYGFLQGDEAILLSPESPRILVAPTTNEYCYIIRVDDTTVETTPNQSEAVLAAIRDAAVDGDIEPIQAVVEDILANQVRRDVMKALQHTFDQADRLTTDARGWLIDDFYLVNWEASLYLRTNDPDSGDYVRAGNEVEQTDRSREFVDLTISRDIEPITVSINGQEFTLTEREMLFLTKVKWMLNRRDYHNDESFWRFADKYADVDPATGQPG